jgi:uncharacterized membrane protein YgaE (UPF0421/DUF939 family)
MHLKLSPPARLGTQAAIAILLATAIAHWVGAYRSYWAVMTAMLLISQTWGESIKKAWTRGAMTLLGGLVGTGLFFIIQGHPYLLFAAIVCCVFLMVYFIETSYLLTVFFVTIFVVFLFASISEWNMRLLEARIYDTFIGAGVAIVTTALVFPITAKTNFRNQLPQFIQKLQAATDQCLNLFNPQPSNEKAMLMEYKHLPAQFNQLQDNLKHINYEYLFKSFPKQKFKQTMLQTTILYHYVTSAIAAYVPIKNAQNIAKLQPEFLDIQQTIDNNYALILATLNNEPSSKTLISLEDARQRLHKKIVGSLNSDPVTQATWFDFASYFYFILKINETLIELATIFGKPLKTP